MRLGKSDPKRDRFERMAEEVFPSLYGTAIRLTRNTEDASDLSQEALVRAYEAFDRFDGRNFKAWMLRILTNLYINRYRKIQRTGTASSLSEEDAAEPIAPAEQSPERLVFDEMLPGEVERALAEVPDVFRTAVILSDIEGMSYDEVAEATDVPVGTVRSRLARGRAILRGLLESYALERGYLKHGTTND
ncbi:MAG TPA: sigma-70 family RNA polymerase sigma factor [Fimbriimonadaceae bacterium]|nr:sigma-70 family RNA polymerase sigma factor [Fimbriimonadaceae bacterium]